MQIILCTINCYTKKQLMVIPLVSCFFFYGHSMENLSAINLYGQLMTLMFFFVWSNNYFNVFLNFFSTKNFQFVVYIVQSNSKILKTSRPKGYARLQLSEFNFPHLCQEKKTYTYVVVCPTLHHHWLYFSGMGLYKNSVLILGNQKWT